MATDFDPDAYIAQKTGGGFDPDTYLAQKTGVPPTGTPPPSALEAGARGLAQGATLGFSNRLEGGVNSLLNNDSYQDELQKATAANEAAKQAHPYVYGGANLAGGLATGVATGGLGAEALGAVGAGALGGAAAGIGYGDPNAGITDSAVEAAKGAVLGAGLAGITQGISNALAPSNLSEGAEYLAEKATGATGKQLSKFSEGAGRELLDKGVVGFGTTPDTIAQRAAGEMTSVGQDIGDALQGIDSQVGGDAISKGEVLAGLQQRIDALSDNPAKANIVKQLQGILGDVDNGPESYSLADAENVKRGFQDKVNWQTPENNPANADASDVFRNLVETKATQLNPDLAELFKASKESYGNLAPVQEAAARRAATLQASPVGGLLDVTSAVGGAAMGHPITGIAGAAARRFISPRLASAGAVTIDKLADVVRTAPETLGPWAQQLSAAQARGGVSLAATNNILSQTSPGYRQHMDKLFNGNSGNGANNGE